MTFNYVNDWRPEDVAKSQAFWSDLRDSFDMLLTNPMEAYASLIALSVWFGLVVLGLLAPRN